MNEPLRARLLELIARDDATRDRLYKEGALFHQAYHPEMEAVHDANAAALREIIAEHGWPGRSLVGDDGAAAAWRIAQHAIGHPDFMRACLPLVQAAAAAGETEPWHAAYMEDRIRVYEGRPQRWGSQFDWNQAGTAIEPMVGVEEPGTVDARRAALGLKPLVWRHEPLPGEPPPADPAGRRAEYEAWLRRTGWRH